MQAFAFAKLRRISVAPLALALVFSTGCGAAYYGTAIGILATQGEDDVDLSFPDGQPHAPTVPPLVEVDYGGTGTQITVTRTVGGIPTQVTGSQIQGFVFPPTFGEAISNRDADINLFDGDRLVVRINSAAAQELAFTAVDVASTGPGVAAMLEAKLRALDLMDPNIANLTVTYDEATRSYTFRTGLPSEQAEILFESPIRAGDSVFPNASSTATASRLGLGEANGGISYDGAEVVRINVVNSGTDGIPAGTPVRLYLSHDKVLDADEDLLFDSILLDASVAVGQARVFTRRNGNAPAARLIDSDITPGKYYVLFSLLPSGGESLISNNLVNSLQPVEVVQPADDPATPAVEVADALDFAPTGTTSPISLVMGNQFTAGVGITNYGAAVGVTGQSIDLDLVLSANAVFDPPAGYFDPAGAVAGAYVNPRDPSRPVTVMMSGTSAAGAPLTSTLTGDTIEVFFDAAGTQSVQQLIDHLNVVHGNRVDAFHDGVGTVTAPGSFQALIAAITGAMGSTDQVARDVFVATRQVTFPQSPINTNRTFTLAGPLRPNAILPSRLPLKLRPLFRIRPTILPAPVDPENANNNLREAANHVRIYDPAAAIFDSDTGTVLPTVNADDFAKLQFVSQSGINTSQIRQGQQRVFSFEIPDNGLPIEASQILILVRSKDFDPHVDLLSAGGDYIAGDDDSDAGNTALLYVPVQAAAGNRFFYVVVSSARFDESDLTSGNESFELTVSVNARETTDPGLAKAVGVGGVVRGRNARYELGAPRIESDVLIPISMTNAKAEVMFVLPAAARVRFRSQPVFNIGVDAKLTGFVAGGTAAVAFDDQQVLDASASGIVYKPLGGNSLDYFELPKGVYTFAIEGVDNPPVGDGQTDLRLEIDAEFKPD